MGSMTSPVQPTLLTTTHFPVAEISTVYPVIGNPKVYDEITEAIRQHGNNQGTIQIQTSFQETRLPITTHLFKNLKLNNDDHGDFLMVRSLEVYTFPGQEAKRGWVQLLTFIPGTTESDKTNEPTDTMIQHSILLSAAYFLGAPQPIGQLTLTDKNNDKIDEIQFTDRGQTKTYDALKPNQTFNDQALFDALFNAQAFLFNQVGYLDILLAVHDIGNKAAEAQVKSITTFYNQLSFGFQTLKTCYQNILKSPRLKAKYEKEKPDFLPLSRIMIAEADKVLALPKKELDKIAELSTRSEKLMKEALDQFRWQEGDWAKKKMERAEFYKTLAETTDPAKRRDLVEKYSAVVVGAHQQGLFPMIEELNKIARQYGYKSYPDYYDRVNYGMSPEDFAALVESFHQKSSATLAEYIGELQKMNGGQPVYEWDVDYLSERYIKEKTGGSLPKLTFEEAYAIAKRWFQDIGWDLDQPPFKDKIFFDMKKRDNKKGNAFATTIDDGSRAWFNTNFDPNEKIALEDLNTVIHELTHDAQFIFGARHGKGNLVTGYGGSPSTWVEGSAFAMGDIVYNRSWMDRYLSHLPEFKDPKVRAVAADVLNKQQVYKNMMVLCRALWENNLYQDKNPEGSPRSLATRQHFWQEITKKYMHVETMDATKGGYIYATPHFAGSPGYYVSYGGGRPLGVQVLEPIYAALSKNNPSLLRQGGNVFRRVLEEGARNLTAQDLSQAIEKAKREVVLAHR